VLAEITSDYVIYDINLCVFGLVEHATEAEKTQKYRGKRDSFPHAEEKIMINPSRTFIYYSYHK